MGFTAVTIGLRNRSPLPSQAQNYKMNPETYTKTVAKADLNCSASSGI